MYCVYGLWVFTVLQFVMNKWYLCFFCWPSLWYLCLMNQSYHQCHPELFRGSKHVKVMWPIQLYFKTVNEKLYVQFSWWTSSKHWTGRNDSESFETVATPSPRLCKRSINSVFKLKKKAYKQNVLSIMKAF